MVAAYRMASETIIISSPRSNDIWRTGSEYDIVWEADNSENVRIELYKGDEIVDTLSSSVITSPSYSLPVRMSTSQKVT